MLSHVLLLARRGERKSAEEKRCALKTSREDAGVSGGYPAEVTKKCIGKVLCAEDLTLVISSNLRKQPQRAQLSLFEFMSYLSLTKVCP